MIFYAKEKRITHSVFDFVHHFSGFVHYFRVAQRTADQQQPD